MTEAKSRRLARGLFGTFLIFLALEIVLLIAARTGPRPPTSSLVSDLSFTIIFSLFSPPETRVLPGTSKE